MGLFTKAEELIAIDVGASSIKFVEMDLKGDAPVVNQFAVVPLTGEIFQGSAIGSTEQVSTTISTMLEAAGIAGKRVVTAMPSPSVFSKRVQLARVPLSELGSTIEFEAANYVPQSTNGLKLDFHVIGASGKSHLDVLLVAVKNEVVDSYLDVIASAGLDTAVVDIDYFALQNIFEANYPELLDKNVALLNVGSRFTTINICRGGQSLVTSDIGIGGKSFTEALASELELSPQDAEKAKRAADPAHPRHSSIEEVVDRLVEAAASELNRQLSLVWNSGGADEGIDTIFISGGGALIRGFLEELSEKTGVKCERLNPFKLVQIGSSIDRTQLEAMSPLIAVCAGLGLRQAGDKEIPDYDQD